MTTTIEVKFDPTDLPEWARANEDVVRYCKVSLAFRSNVHSATTYQMREVCRHEAKAWREGVAL